MLLLNQVYQVGERYHIGESQYQSMKMSSDKTNYGFNNVNSHLMRNVEWGAVAYLCYSEYGKVPQINACGSYATDKNKTGYYYNMMTGAGPNGVDEKRYEYNEDTFQTTVAYNTTNGLKASTTGNITGIYDMSGGSMERVAIYLDNGNKHLELYGKSDDGTVKYFENGKLNSKYQAYWETYEVSEEEKNNQIVIDESETLTQEELLGLTKVELKHHQARQRLTEANFNNMAKHKGIGVNEVANSFSFHAPASTTKGWNWFVTPEQALAGTKTGGIAWDNDGVFIGHAHEPILLRGGNFVNESKSGVLYSLFTSGLVHYNDGFRPVIIL